MLHGNLKDHIILTKSQIDLKPGCKLMFVPCLSKEKIKFRPFRDPGRPFYFHQESLNSNSTGWGSIQVP